MLSFYPRSMSNPNPPPPADADLAVLAHRIMAASGSDREAEAELYRCLAPRVRLYGLRHLRDAAAAADLAQDVLLLTIRRLGSGEIRNPQQVVSFVLSTCRQMVLDRRRSLARRQGILQTFLQDLYPSQPGERYDLDSARLRNCIELLSERERAVILLSFYDERGAAEVAGELGVSAANVRVIRHRSIERLRSCLEGTGGAQ
jgi:RNA polymerase sigma-70 factor (ECF subfamily)